MTDNPNRVLNMTYSVRLEHIAQVSDLAERLNTSKSEIVRKAIEAYYLRQEEASDTSPESTPAPTPEEA
jgi:predicted transcriptional regulator